MKTGRTAWCKHYRAMSQHDTCEAGVLYETLKGLPFDSRPCFRKGDEPIRCGCDLVQFPTAEEIEAEEAEMRLRMEKTMKARQAIVESLGGPWKKGMPGHSGCIDCPACSKSDCLRFSRSARNGHIHASCLTDGCVRWME